MRTLLISLLALAVVAPTASAANPWLERRVLHIAHQGGEREAPSNTFFAYEKALRNGADVLEMDINITSDRQIVVYHDTTLDSRTDGTGKVNSRTLQYVKSLDPSDNSLWMTLYGGIATGKRKPPRGFTREDFQIPTLREVLQRYPNKLMNIEIKGAAPDSVAAQTFAEESIAGAPTAFDTAVELSKLLNEFGRDDDTIVVSFSDLATQRFKLLAPLVNTAPGLGGTGAFYASTREAGPGAPVPGHVALQPPTVFQNLIEVPTRDFVTDAHANNLAVHVWLATDEEENAGLYGKLIDNGVDGIMTDFPSRLEQTLNDRGVRWKNGPTPRFGKRRGRR